MASLRHSSAGRLWTRTGPSRRFSSTERCGKRLNRWKTMPTFWRWRAIWLSPSGTSVSPLREIFLDITLSDAENGHDHHVPDAGHDQQFDHPRIGVIDITDCAQDFGILDDTCQGGQLDHADGFIADRRHDHPHRLRQHDG